MPSKDTTGKVTLKEKLLYKTQKLRKWGSAAQKAALEKARKASAAARSVGKSVVSAAKSTGSRAAGAAKLGVSKAKIGANRLYNKATGSTTSALRKTQTIKAAVKNLKTSATNKASAAKATITKKASAAKSAITKKASAAKSAVVSSAASGALAVRSLRNSISNKNAPGGGRGATMGGPSAKPAQAGTGGGRRGAPNSQQRELKNRINEYIKRNRMM